MKKPKIIKPLEFDWDDGNKDKNKRKHNVSTSESEEIFADPKLKTFKDIIHSQKEVRFSALSQTISGRKLFLSFTIRGNKIRVISARDQSQKERRLYESK